VDSGRNTTYNFDSVYRLSTAITTGSANYPQWGLSWGYDRYGNRLNQTLTAGSGYSGSVTVDATTNRIVQTTGTTYAYDANGNMTNDNLNTIAYDAENHAISSGGSLGSGSYTYDGNGLRVKKVSGSTTTVYIFSGSKVIAEYDNGAAPAAPSREYVYGGSTLLAKIDSSGTKYYHQDHLSNRVVTDSSGNTSAQLGHFPFGESWYNSTNDKLLFTSYKRDAESGNDYAQARMYVSRLARFSSPDPVAGSTDDPQSFNRYAYVHNKPTGATDPTGMDMVDGNCPMDVARVIRRRHPELIGLGRSWGDADLDFLEGDDCPDPNAGSLGGGSFGSLSLDPPSWTDASVSFAGTNPGQIWNVINAQQDRAFWGYQYYMLPGNANEGAQGEQRYVSIMNTGWDPELRKQYYEYEFTGGDGSIFERQKELAALKFGQQACPGQASTAVASCIMQVYNQLPSDSGGVQIQGGNYDFSYTGIQINGQTVNPTEFHCAFSRCGLFDSLDYSHHDGTFHIDTATPWFIPIGTVAHLAVDLIGGKTWWKGGIPRFP
jgi:RHS repeat-associated protein